MAFCSKCGTPVEDDAAFCTSCGAPINAVPVQQTSKDSPANNPIANGLVKLPSISDWVGIGLIVLSFIFLFLSWGKIDTGLFGDIHVGIFGVKGFAGLGASTFDVSVCFGIANIFGILTIIAFVVYLVAYFIDLGKLVPSLENIDLCKIGKLAYFICYGAAIVFGFIGILTGECSLAVGFFFSLVFYILAILGDKKELLAKISPALK